MISSKQARKIANSMQMVKMEDISKDILDASRKGYFQCGPYLLSKSQQATLQKDGYKLLPQLITNRFSITWE